MPDKKITRMKKAHRVLYEFPFEVVQLEKGYADRILRIDLDKNEIKILPVSRQMKDLWTGGKGFDLWLMLQEINADTKWDDNNNPICFSQGPLGGTASFPGSGKTLVTALSPMTKSVMDCNVGGYFGPYLKFSGFDTLVLLGKASEDVIILIDAVNGRITIEAAPEESIDSHILAEELTEMYADDELDRRNIACVTAGRGAEHTHMGVLNFSFYDWRRALPRIKQAGRGGIGTVFRDKKIKALVLKNRQITPAWRIEETRAAKLVTPKKISVQRSKSDIEEIGRIIEKWQSDPEYAIEIMQDIQDRFRHVSKTAIDEICKKTGRQKAHLYHIATFYKSFSLEPKGETIVQVCMGTACHVKGSAKILESFERVLGISAGETTEDMKYSLEAAACLGACSIAPVVKIGEEVYGNVQAKDVEKLLKNAGKTKEGAPSETDEEAASVVKLSPADLDRISGKEEKENSAYKGILLVCTGTGCASAKGFSIRDRLTEVIREKGLDGDYLVKGTGCQGLCAMGPVIVVEPERTFYQKVRPKDIEEIVDALAEGKTVERLLHKDPVTGAVIGKIDEIGFFGRQQHIALRNCGLIDPENIDDYIARGGYGALRKVLEGISQEDVIREVTASGLRGRGGGGFPTGIKWESGFNAAREKDEEIFIACNADEGGPGAFSDRSIIEADPHSVIEGMLIGAYAAGATTGFIYIRKEYPLAMERLKKAVSQCIDYGLLGDNILGSDLSFDINIHRGAGAFVSGESSAVIASMSGKAGEPRPKYLHSFESGLRDKPTILDNVETWANIPVIIEKGSGWFSSIGTGDVSKSPWNGSSGTKVFSLTGDVRNTGMIEVPMGTTLREIIEDIGGGIPGGRGFKAVQTGGPSGGCLPSKMLDIPVDFDSLIEAGSMIGSGVISIMDDRTCMVDVARDSINFLMEESCGKCTPCREGLLHMSNLLTRICSGEGKAGDIETLEELCLTIKETSLCQLGGSAPNPVLSTLKYFMEEYKQHIDEKKCAGGICKALITYHIDAEKCTGCTLCAINCPVKVISGEKKKTHFIDTGNCIKCGICYESCNFDAVEVI
ncbi:MAG: NAD(P)H-dependent oxidoreductase subunit E [Candidatus Krumholzibacteriota bacterium]|nr:NAD(P)H-dependent oxidoreductase subunit E [Candidatus Krumholzibacteriota bacterium]